jgi:orotidine-5'-phosphate decarboxylase
MNPIDRLIVALDHPTAEAALAQVDLLGDQVVRYKVGLELYLAAGAAVVDALKQRGKQVFLDLKLHDIPETVARAAKIVACYGVDLITVHASGGLEMLKRAADAARPSGAKVLAVTVLTSLDANDLRRDGHPLSVEALVTQRALLAAEAGCDGVVASPLEVRAIRAAVRPPFLIVTPGVRRAASTDDQKRVATPRQAREHGADLVVVGRPIRDASDPRAEAARFVEELG